MNTKMTTISEDDQNISINEGSLSKINADVAAAAEKEGLDDKQKSALAKVGDFCLNAIKKQAFDTSTKYIDILFLNQLVDATAEIYGKELLKMDLTKLSEIYEELHKDPAIKNAQKYAALDSRKDDAHSVDEIDSDSLRYWALWFSNDKNNSLTKIISEFKKSQEKIAKKAKAAQDKLVNDIKAAKLDKDITNDDISKFGSVLILMFAEKAKPEDIKKKVEELRKTATESMTSKISKIQTHNRLVSLNLLAESKILITEDLHNQLIIESLLENREIVEANVEWLLQEGFFGNIKDKISSAKKKLTDKIVGGAKLLAKVAGTTGFKGLLKGAGIAISTATLGLGATVIIKLFDFVETYGKNIRNAVERQWTRFANSKGVIAEMTFNLSNDKKSKYSLRYYITDKVWRCINMKDLLKSPTKDFTKEILNGNIGKKFRDRIAEQWNLIFSKDEKSGTSNFLLIINNSEKIDINDKLKKLLSDFAESYDTILKDCLELPKIDTRNLSMSTALGKDK